MSIFFKKIGKIINKTPHTSTVWFSFVFQPTLVALSSNWARKCSANLFLQLLCPHSGGSTHHYIFRNPEFIRLLCLVKQSWYLWHIWKDPCLVAPPVSTDLLPPAGHPSSPGPSHLKLSAFPKNMLSTLLIPWLSQAISFLQHLCLCCSLEELHCSRLTLDPAHEVPFSTTPLSPSLPHHPHTGQN